MCSQKLLICQKQIKVIKNDNLVHVSTENLHKNLCDIVIAILNIKTEVKPGNTRSKQQQKLNKSILSKVSNAFVTGKTNATFSNSFLAQVKSFFDEIR